jgi:hypothetical protein
MQKQFISYDFLSKQAKFCLDHPSWWYENNKGTTRKNNNTFNIENIRK